MARRFSPPLSHAAISRLKVVPQLQDNPYIICGRKAGQHLVNLNDAWGRIRKAAGLNDLRIHDLRRTVGSWLVRDGASLHLVGSVLNHKDQKTTAGYAYFQTKERHKALDKHGRNVVDFASRLTSGLRRRREQVIRAFGHSSAQSRAASHLYARSAV